MACDDIDEVLPELAGHIFILGLFGGQFQRDRQHVERIHGHPTGGVGLLDLAAGGKRVASVKYSDVVQAEKSTLEDVHTVGVFAIHPPGEIQQEFVKDALQKSPVAVSASFLSIL